jgi:hypothetical protein
MRLRYAAESLLDRYITSPYRRIPVDHGKVPKQFKHIDVFSASTSEITMLFRLKNDANCNAGFGCHNVNFIRLGTRYRPLSEESYDFFRNHVATDPPREYCDSRMRFEHTLYETVLGVPARFDDIQHVKTTISEIDHLFKSSHDRMTRDVALRREDRSPIGMVTLMKVRPKPYDYDCLYLMTLEILRLAAQYDARPSGLRCDKEPVVRLMDINADEAKVVLRAVSDAFRTV